MEVTSSHHCIRNQALYNVQRPKAADMACDCDIHHYSIQCLKRIAENSATHTEEECHQAKTIVRNVVKLDSAYLQGPCWKLEIRHDRNIYTPNINKH